MDFHEQISTRPVSFANYMNLTCAEPETNLPDGSKICCNDTGAIVFMHYASGVKVLRHDSYVMCTNDNGEHWLGDSRSVWCRIN